MTLPEIIALSVGGTLLSAYRYEIKQSVLGFYAKIRTAIKKPKTVQQLLLEIFRFGHSPQTAKQCYSDEELVLLHKCLASGFLEEPTDERKPYIITEVGKLTMIES